MIIDCHGHFTTVPQSFRDWRTRQVQSATIRQTLPIHAMHYQRCRYPRRHREWTTKVAARAGQRSHTVLSNRGSDEPSPRKRTHQPGMGGSFQQQRQARHRTLPGQLCAGLPVATIPGAPPANSIPELRRCVEQMGFVGCNLNPDPSGGYWTGKPMTDRDWYPLYEVLCELDVPAMIHVAASCNPNFHGTGAHYLNADTSVFMQLVQGDLFKDFPTLRFIIPHGGGAVPYHWGRYRGMSLEIAKRPLEGLLDNIFFDTCVYHHPGVALLTRGDSHDQCTIRVGDDRCRPWQGSTNRPVLRRHQTLHRRVLVSRRGRSTHDLLGQRATRLSAAGCTAERQGSIAAMKSRIVDIHPHIISDDEKRYPPAPLFGKRSDWSQERPCTVETLIAAMDAAGVAKAAVVHSSTTYGFDNSYVVDGCNRIPRRLAAVGSVDMPAINSPTVIREWVAKGLVGVRIFTGGSTKDFDPSELEDPHSFPAWEVIEELGMPMCIQTGPVGLPQVAMLAKKIPAGEHHT